MARAFLDTNVFCYAVDGKDPGKQARARELISELARSGEGVVSVQVIQEFASNAVGKLGFSPTEAAALCESFADHRVISPDLALVRNALRLMTAASVSFWDACILAAAEFAQCKTLYTEDLSAEHRIAGILIKNPFA